MRFVNPDGLSVPIGYSHVVTTNARQIIYIAGQIALNSQGELIGKNDFMAQTKQVYENLNLALSSVGATFENVVKTTTYVVHSDTEKLKTVGLIRAQYQTSAHRPTSTYLSVEGLALRELLIEIEAIAVIE